MQMMNFASTGRKRVRCRAAVNPECATGPYKPG
jgi:hypothetical protein